LEDSRNLSILVETVPRRQTSFGASVTLLLPSLPRPTRPRIKGRRESSKQVLYEVYKVMKTAWNLFRVSSRNGSWRDRFAIPKQALISGCSKHDPLIVDGPRKAAREARSFQNGRAVWRCQSFPGSFYRARPILASPGSRGLSDTLTYKEVQKRNWSTHRFLSINSWSCSFTLGGEYATSNTRSAQTSTRYHYHRHPTIHLSRYWHYWRHL